MEAARSPLESAVGRDEHAAVVFGVNLPILLDFVFHRDLPLEELVPRLLEKGRESVQSVPDLLNRCPSYSYRVDERLIHGQVVVGWGSQLRPDRYLVVDQLLATSEWEQELYTLGVPERIGVEFLAPGPAREAASPAGGSPSSGAFFSLGTSPPCWNSPVEGCWRERF